MTEQTWSRKNLLYSRGVATIYGRTHVRTFRNDILLLLFSMAKSVFGVFGGFDRLLLITLLRFYDRNTDKYFTVLNSVNAIQFHAEVQNQINFYASTTTIAK